jgi:hypothetical protein
MIERITKSLTSLPGYVGEYRRPIAIALEVIFGGTILGIGIYFAQGAGLGLGALFGIGGGGTITIICLALTTFLLLKKTKEDQIESAPVKVKKGDAKEAWNSLLADPTKFSAEFGINSHVVEGFKKAAKRLNKPPAFERIGMTRLAGNRSLILNNGEGILPSLFTRPVIYQGLTLSEIHSSANDLLIIDMSDACDPQEWASYYGVYEESDEESESKFQGTVYILSPKEARQLSRGILPTLPTKLKKLL